MITQSERRQRVNDINQARAQGVHLELVCEVVGISLGTYRRWTRVAQSRPMADRRRYARCPRIV